MATVEQIKQEILDHYEAPEHSLWVWSELKWDSQSTKGVTLPSGEIKFVEQHGGEGEGEDYWFVFGIGNQLFRANGYYESWDGVTWDDDNPEEVEAVQVMVTQYQRKK